MAESNDERRYPDHHSIAELHAIATKALAEGDEYGRALLRDQLHTEEQRERG